jgi:hypothetical protein
MQGPPGKKAPTSQPAGRARLSSRKKSVSVRHRHRRPTTGVATAAAIVTAVATADAIVVIVVGRCTATTMHHPTIKHVLRIVIPLVLSTA